MGGAIQEFTIFCKPMHFIGKCTPTIPKLGLYAIYGASAIKVKFYSGAFLEFFYFHIQAQWFKISEKVQNFALEWGHRFSNLMH